MKIDDRVFWFNGEHLGYIQVYTGIIHAVEKEHYQIYSSNKPMFITLAKREVFSESQIESQMERRRVLWAREYVKNAKREATQMAKHNVVVGYHTRNKIPK